MSGARSGIKRVVERGLRYLGPAALARRAVRGRTLVLAWHNVVPDDSPVEGDRSLHLPLGSFRRQLDVIQALAAVVPLSDVLDGAGNPGRPRVALTFDDAYRGALVHAVPELRSRGLPATIFVPPAFVPARSFWWDDFASDVDSEATTFRDRALTEWRGRDEEVRRQAGARRAAPLSVDQRCGSLTDLDEAASGGLVTLGSHSWSHPNLAALDGIDLLEELRRSLRWLVEHFPSVSIPWISYPYGRESLAVRQASKDAGYSAGLRVDGGWIPSADLDRFNVPRLNIPSGLSPDGLALRLSGLNR